MKLTEADFRLFYKVIGALMEAEKKEIARSVVDWLQEKVKVKNLIFVFNYDAILFNGWWELCREAARRGVAERSETKERWVSGLIYVRSCQENKVFKAVS